MALAFVLAVLALAGAAATWRTWRRQADERRSVRDHQHALETLRHMSDRQLPSHPSTALSATLNGGPGHDTPTASRRVRPAAASVSAAARAPLRRVSTPKSSLASKRAGAPPARASKRAPASAESAAASGSNGNGAMRPTLVFVDDGLGTSAAGSAVVDGPQDAGYIGPQRHASSATAPERRVRFGPGAWRMSPAERFRPRGRVRRSHLFAVAAAVLIVVLAVAVGVAVSSGPSHATGTNTPRASRVPTPSERGNTPSVASGPPSATASSVGPVAPVSGSATAATYAAPPSPYDVVLRASGPCWVMATEQASGTVVWTGTMAPASTRSIPADGGLVVHLGAARNVSVWMNGQQVQLPAGFRSVFDLTFQA